MSTMPPMTRPTIAFQSFMFAGVAVMLLLLLFVVYSYQTTIVRTSEDFSTLTKRVNAIQQSLGSIETSFKRLEIYENQLFLRDDVANAIDRFEAEKADIQRLLPIVRYQALVLDAQAIVADTERLKRDVEAYVQTFSAITSLIVDIGLDDASGQRQHLTRLHDALSVYLVDNTLARGQVMLGTIRSTAEISLQRGGLEFIEQTYRTLEELENYLNAVDPTSPSLTTLAEYRVTLEEITRRYAKISSLEVQFDSQHAQMNVALEALRAQIDATAQTMVADIEEDLMDNRKTSLTSGVLSILLFVVVSAFLLFKLRQLLRKEQKSKAQLQDARDQLEEKVQLRTQELESAKDEAETALEKVATLLDNSGQGFLSLGKELKVHAGYSRECGDIFGRDVEGLLIDELLAPDDSQKREVIRKGITLAFGKQSDKLLQKALLSIIPSTYELGGKVLRAEYKFVKSDQMMLILTDVTDEKQLQDKLAEERKRLQFIVSAMENRSNMLEIVRDYREFVTTTLPRLLSKRDDPEATLAELYRLVHTFKGVFAQDSVPTVPVILHQVESRLGRLRDEHSGYTVNTIKTVFASFDLLAPLEEDISLLKEKIGESYFRSEKELSIPARKIDHLEAKAKQILQPESGQADDTGHDLLQSIRKLRFESLESLLTPHFRAAGELAPRLGKEVAPIRYNGPEIMVDPNSLGPFLKTIIHVFRNAIDHGVEDPDTRLMADKDEIASVTCTAKIGDNGFKLIITDDGAGIDAEAILAKAVEKGLVDPTTAASYGTDAALAFIFADGFSTKDTASVVSGRGVGMAAVHHALTAIGGSVEIDTAIGKGTRFTFLLPNQDLHWHEEEGSGQAQLIENLMAPIPDIVRTYFSAEIGEQANMGTDIQIINNSHIDAFIATIGYETLHCEMGVSVSTSFLEALTKSIHPGKSDEIIAMLQEDVGRELANTLFGQATLHYTHMDTHIKMGTPTVLSSDAAVRLIGDQVCWGVTGTWRDMDITIFCNRTGDHD